MDGQVLRRDPRSFRNGQDTGGSRTPEELRRSYTAGLGAGADGLGVAIQRLGELGTSLVDGADRAVAELTDTFGGLRMLFTSTKEELDTLPPGFSEEDVGRVLAAAGAVPKLSSLFHYSFDGIQITQAMRDAGDVSGSACLGVLPRR